MKLNINTSINIIEKKVQKITVFIKLGKSINKCTLEIRNVQKITLFMKLGNSNNKYILEI